MTILVTGGAGYIGSHMVLELIDHGYDVAILDDLSTGCSAVIHKDARFFQGDVADEAIIDRICQSCDISAVFHFAGSTSLPESIGDPLRYFQNNTEASRALVQNLLRYGVRHIVFSSTAAVYGATSSAPIAETAPCQPASPYGWSKLFTEQMLQDASRASGIGIAILRYFNVAGADPAGRIGQSTPDAQSLIKVACAVAAGKRDVLEIYGNDYATPDGTCVRDYIHVSDLVIAHRLALVALQSGGANILCNLGYGKGHSVREIADAVGRAAGAPLPVRNQPRRAGDQAIVISNADLARERLGWTPAFDDIDVILKTAFAWENVPAR
ncbi:UDP-glucose 4-epimerase [Yoonia tamlensis]|uniref:UDP-glucose 4-epimerase n=1 Tax=Yoonia tamlensis TaxID=390270 RepID=A0A1I6FY54_9RHOB|nr:UDP-glucose 4-epimerase GalE [Yoonia tamlensis]SFR34882.1 UDP-glucose 4-epimerase [Yoonia tamlensis]